MGPGFENKILSNYHNFYCKIVSNSFGLAPGPVLGGSISNSMGPGFERKILSNSVNPCGKLSLTRLGQRGFILGITRFRIPLTWFRFAHVHAVSVFAQYAVAMLG